jgi:Mannosyltransferase (PIG-V)
VSSTETYPSAAPTLGEGPQPIEHAHERSAAMRDVWRALWSSRLLVWCSGSGAVLALGPGPMRHAFNPAGLTSGLGRLGEALAAPAARWDAAWYLVIAHYGYRPDLGSFTASRTAFFPLYPLAVGTLERTGAQPVVAGVLISIAALAVALYGMHRLTSLEGARLASGRGGRLARAFAANDTPRVVVLLSAFAPMAFYFSAIYNESLYLALSVWVFLCARTGRFGAAAALGALASATRNTGVLLVVPVALLYLYGPREDRAPDFATGRSARPRYRVRQDALWLLLIPAGLALYMAHLALAGGDALAPFHAQAAWSRHFAGPIAGVWDGAKAAFDGARQLVSAQRAHLYFDTGPGSPFIGAGHNLMLFAFLLAAVPLIVGVLRALPFAYGAYVLSALALPLSFPVAGQPLMSLPRFLLVLFPLNMWLGARLARHTRALTVALVCSGALLAFFTAEFSTWHWVA